MPNKRKSIVSFCLLLCLSLTSFAQEKLGITGRVMTDSITVLSNASIYLVEVGSKKIVKATISDHKGEYQFDNVLSAKYIVEAVAVGKTKGESNSFDVKNQPIRVSDMVLMNESSVLEEVTIRRDLQLPIIQNINGKLVMNIENSSISAGNNALEVLKRAPGVNVDKDENISLMGQQGVNITIDGRPTYMTGEQLASFLKSTDGSQIKSIELSTTRSAKDDAEGAAGVINISMKRNKLEGFNGTFLASVGMGKRYRANSSLNLNYKKNNTTFFSNYAYTDNKSLETIRIERRISNANDNTFFDQNSEMFERDQTHNYKLGVEQKTSSRNTLLAQFTGNNNIESGENEGETLMGSNKGLVDSIMYSIADSRERFDRYSLNVNNEFQIDSTGKKLIADIDYSLFETNNTVNYQYDSYFADRTHMYAPEYENSLSGTKIKIVAAKVDYTQKLASGMVELGVKYSHVDSDNDIIFNKRLGTAWSNDVKRSNIFAYIEQISAGYIDYSREIGQWSVKAGLRAEYTISDGLSITQDKHVKRDYFDLFPSASLSYNLNENNVFSASYARKISRPSYRHLNPFEYYIDKRTFMRGNPYLNPQYTDGFALNYTLFKMFNIALGYDLTRDAMVESMGQDSVLKTTWVTRENLGKQSTSYLNLSIPARIGSFWSMYNNLTGIYMHFEGPIAGHYVSQGSLFFQGKSTNTFKISNRISSELVLEYNSPFLYNVYKIHGRFKSDVGASYNFKDERSSLKLAITDIFRSYYNNISTNFNEFDSNIHQYNDVQSIRLTFSYKFGNLKQVIRKKENNSEEKSRAL